MISEVNQLITYGTLNAIAVHIEGRIKNLKSELKTCEAFNNQLEATGKGSEINHMRLHHLDGQIEALEKLLPLVEKAVEVSK